MELHEYEWALYEMRGHRPSDKDANLTHTRPNESRATVQRGNN